MASISSPGISSGLDVKALVESLVNAEITPSKTRIEKKEASYNSELSALGQIKSALAKLQASTAKLSDLKQFNAQRISVTDTNILNANLNEQALPGNFQIDVQKLASQQTLASKTFTNSNTAVGTGSMKIEFGTYSNDLSTFTANSSKPPVTINIGANQNSLLAIKEAINNAKAGVQASIINDGGGARLTISSTTTGKNYAMKISVDDDDDNNSNSSGLSALAYDPTLTINQLDQKIAAEDSEVIINGITLNQSSNQLKNAVDGLTIDLKKAQPGTLVYVNVDRNTSQAASAVTEFVKQYNETISTLNNFTGYNAETKKGGIFQADTRLRNFKLNLANTISDIQNPQGSIQTLADIGIKTNSKGLLDLNTAKLNTAIEKNYDAISKLFVKTATATDNNLLINAVGRDVKAGNYNLQIDSFTPGSVLTGTLGDLPINSTDGITLAGTGSLKNLSLKVIGGSTGNRGMIEVNDGLGVKLNQLLSNYLDDAGGLAERTTLLNQQIAALGNEKGALVKHTENIESRYMKQFTALDSLLAQMQSTSLFLSQQLEHLPTLTKRR